MDANKLFSLAGLATGGVSTISGSATSLVGTGIFPGSSVRISTLIKDLPKGSKSLFSKLHLECIKEVFPNLGSLDNSMKGEVGSEETTDTSFKLSDVTTPSGPLKGCLNVDLNYYEKDNKGALAGTIEMAVSKGDYGIILLDSIGNMFESTKYHFEHRVFFLKKTSNNWSIETGFQWKDGLFVQEGASVNSALWSGLDELNLKTIWDPQLCESLESCQALNGPELTTDSYLKSFRWTTTPPKKKNLWQSLEIKRTGTGGVSYYQDFWDGKEVPEFTSFTSYPSIVSAGIFKDGSWKKPKKNSGPTVDSASIKKWLEIFKGDKGEWKQKSA